MQPVMVSLSEEDDIDLDERSNIRTSSRNPRPTRRGRETALGSVDRWSRLEPLTTGPIVSNHVLISHWCPG
jgi:hypothetical protein